MIFSVDPHRMNPAKMLCRDCGSSYTHGSRASKEVRQAVAELVLDAAQRHAIHYHHTLDVDTPSGILGTACRRVTVGPDGIGQCQAR